MRRVLRVLATAAAAVAAVSVAAAARRDLQTPAPQPGPAVVAGQVIDATTNRPVGGAIVMLADGQMRPPPFLPSTSQRRATAVATDEGRFVFRDVPAGTYWITATREGYAPGASGRRRIDGPAQQFAVAAGTRVTDANIVM